MVEAQPVCEIAREGGVDGCGVSVVEEEEAEGDLLLLGLLYFLFREKADEELLVALGLLLIL